MTPKMNSPATTPFRNQMPRSATEKQAQMDGQSCLVSTWEGRGAISCRPRAGIARRHALLVLYRNADALQCCHLVLSLKHLLRNVST